jgi:pimeloyl-ACP methyl ester carboxylesterase
VYQVIRKILAGLLVVMAAFAATFYFLSGPTLPNLSVGRNDTRAPGSVIAVDRVGGHNRLVLGAMLWWADLPVKTSVTDGVEMFRIKYWSEVNGQPVEASGLMSVPHATLRGRASHGTVMYLHGTNPSRAGSPSSPGSEEGLVPTAIFAGGGYTLLAPDYFGLGTSKAQPAYLHSGATAAAARDLVVASQSVAKMLKAPFSSDLYLTGFSQGGHATAVVQRAFEAVPVPGVKVKASAAVAGAFDLLGISLPYALKHKHSLYLGYLGTAYAVQYNQPLDSLFTLQYAATLPRLFDGDHSVEAIEAGLPRDPRALFLPERLAEIEAGKLNWFTAALEKNEAYRWIPKAPIRLYYGDRDTDVSPQDSKNFYAIASKLGGNIRLIPVGPYAHSESAYHAVPTARLWFDELTASKKGR